MPYLAIAPTHIDWQHRARLLRDGKPVEVAGEGNGPLAGLVHGFNATAVPRVEIVSYSQHALSAGEEAAAIPFWISFPD